MDFAAKPLSGYEDQGVCGWGYSTRPVRVVGESVGRIGDKNRTRSIVWALLSVVWVWILLRGSVGVEHRLLTLAHYLSPKPSFEIPQLSVCGKSRRHLVSYA